MLKFFEELKTYKIVKTSRKTVKNVDSTQKVVNHWLTCCYIFFFFLLLCKVNIKASVLSE